MLYHERANIPQATKHPKTHNVHGKIFSQTKYYRGKSDITYYCNRTTNYTGVSKEIPQV
jgi:t-SNARE complex subunit (syntaxin)